MKYKKVFSVVLFFTLFIFTINLASAIEDDNFTHAYDLGALASGNAIDTVGTEDGVANSIGNYSSVIEGRTAVYFDGSAGFAMGSNFLDDYGMITICSGTYPLSTSNYNTVWQFQSGGITGYNAFTLYRMSHSGVETTITSVTSQSANSWYDQCLVYDRVTFKLFYNGSQDGDTMSGLSGVVTQAVAFSLGSVAGDAGTNPLNGYIEYVYIFRRNLSVSEMIEIGSGTRCTGDPCSFVSDTNPPTNSSWNFTANNIIVGENRTIWNPPTN